MNIKQVSLWVVAAGLVFSVAGCNSPSSSASATSQAPSTAASTASASSAKLAMQGIDESLLTKSRQVGACALDQVDGAQLVDSAVVKKNSPATLTGWSSDEKKDAPAHFLLVIVGRQSFGVEIPTGRSRPDVAQSLNSASLANAGFSEVVSFSAVPTGNYQVKFLIQEAGDSQICSTGKQLIVGE